MIKKEYRSYDFEMRADENERGKCVQGRAIVFGQPYDNGYFTEYIDKDALRNCDLKDVRLLVNHNTDMIPLARSRNNNANSTMQLSITDDGMDIRANLDTEGNPTAKELYSAAGRGDINSMSFMFTVEKDRWESLDTDKPVRFITAIRKVYEVSAVTWPAYESTTFEARANLGEALESAEATLESAKRQAAEEAEALNAAKAAEERAAKIEALKARIKATKEA